MPLNGKQLERYRRRHVIFHFTTFSLADGVQAWKRHVEMGYVGMVTGLPNLKTPGDVPLDQWDSWHSLIVNDELSRVVQTPDLLNFEVLTQKGLYRRSVGSWRR